MVPLRFTLPHSGGLDSMHMHVLFQSGFRFSLVHVQMPPVEIDHQKRDRAESPCLPDFVGLTISWKVPNMMGYQSISDLSASTYALYSRPLPL